MKWWKSQSDTDVSHKKMTSSSQEGASTAPDRGIKRQRQVTQVTIQFLIIQTSVPLTFLVVVTFKNY